MLAAHKEVRSYQLGGIYSRGLKGLEKVIMLPKIRLYTERFDLWSAVQFPSQILKAAFFVRCLPPPPV